MLALRKATVINSKHSAIEEILLLARLSMSGFSDSYRLKEEQVII